MRVPQFLFRFCVFRDSLLNVTEQYTNTEFGTLFVVPEALAVIFQVILASEMKSNL